MLLFWLTLVCLGVGLLMFGVWRARAAQNVQMTPEEIIPMAPEEFSRQLGWSANIFSPRAQQALVLSIKEADRFNHNFVGTEHLLLGLVQLGQGGAVSVLEKNGITPKSVRMEIEKLVGMGPSKKMISKTPFTPRAKKVLSLAAKETKGLNDLCVGTEHLLLGLLLEGDGVAPRVLKNLGVDTERMCQEILKGRDLH